MIRRMFRSTPGGTKAVALALVLGVVFAAPPTAGAKKKHHLKSNVVGSSRPR